MYDHTERKTKLEFCASIYNHPDGNIVINTHRDLGGAALGQPIKDDTIRPVSEQETRSIGVRVVSNLTEL
jgi:hypothetical protein